MLPGQAGAYSDALPSVIDDAVIGWSAAAHDANLQLVSGSVQGGDLSGHLVSTCAHDVSSAL